jgi:hypothetical protein
VPLSELNLKRTAVSDKAWTAGSLYDIHKEDRLIFNTEYQRSKVWPPSKKYFLIDSMLRQYDISMIFLRQKENGSFECLDGQQRLRTIFEFIDGEFPIVPAVTQEAEQNTYYSGLPEGLRSRIREFIVHSVVVYNTDDETTSDIFLRLQEGMPLNSPEKLNAMSGYMRKRTIELSHLQFFDGIGLADTRFGHRYVAAQILGLALANTYASVKFPLLKRYYLNYKRADVPHPTVDRVKGALNLLNNSLGTHKPTVRFRADIVSLYTLADAIRTGYSTTGVEGPLGKFILDFLVKVGNYWTLGGTTDSIPYGKYANLRSSSADSGPNIKERQEIILSKFLQFKPDLRPKDPTRGFDYAERLALYQRANGICEKCGTAAAFNKGHADHKKRHADGGLTTIENGRWLCSTCNLSLAHQAT